MAYTIMSLHLYWGEWEMDYADPHNIRLNIIKLSQFYRVSLCLMEVRELGIHIQ